MKRTEIHVPVIAPLASGAAPSYATATIQVASLTDAAAPAVVLNDVTSM